MRSHRSFTLNFADDFLRGQLVLSRSGRASDADKSRYLSQFQIQLAVEKKMSGDPATGVIRTALLEKSKGRLQDGKCFGCSS